ncbi:hypothetical protein [Methylocystis echinoides]|nr:hypothetical protein [Methylocystis echinoides]
MATVAEIERREAEVLRASLRATTTYDEDAAGRLQEWIDRKEARIRGIRGVSELTTKRGVELASDVSALQDMPVDPRLGDRDWEEAALLGAYAALAKVAVERSRAFRLFTYVSAEATDPETKTLAESLASEQLTEAADLRVARRLAWRGEVRSPGLWRDFLTSFDDPVVAADLMRAIGMCAADEIERLANASAQPAEATKLREAAEALRAGGVSTNFLPQRMIDAVFSPLSGRTPIIRARQLSQRLFEVCNGVAIHAGDDEIVRLAQRTAANAITAIKILSAAAEEE